MTIDYLFGQNVSRSLPLDRLTFTYSKKTGGMRRVYLEGKLLATVRPDGGLALTVYGAELLSKSQDFSSNCVVVQEGVEDFIMKGRSVFSKHIVACGDRVRPASDVAVLDSKGKVIAAGKALLSAKMIREGVNGVAVKVRHGRLE